MSSPKGHLSGLNMCFFTKAKQNAWGFKGFKQHKWAQLWFRKKGWKDSALNEQKCKYSQL